MKEELIRWIKGTLSVPQESLGGQSPCPFASEAMTAGGIGWEEANANNYQALIKQLHGSFKGSGKQMIVVYIADGESLDLESVRLFVSEMRNTYASDDIWLLYDHPEQEEKVADQVFNFGPTALFMIQRLSGLVLASRSLKKTGYYKNWPEEYYQKVVGIRESYYRKYFERDELEGGIDDRL